MSGNRVASQAKFARNSQISVIEIDRYAHDMRSMKANPNHSMSRVRELEMKMTTNDTHTHTPHRVAHITLDNTQQTHAK